MDQKKVMTQSERVARHRKNGGNEERAAVYRVLRSKFKVPSVIANKMKYWGYEKIISTLIEEGYKADPNLKLSERL